MSEDKPKARRGFAVMDPAKQRAIASLGGVAAHRGGKGHEWTPEEARHAGRRGGAASRMRKPLRGPLAPRTSIEELLRSKYGDVKE